MQLQPGQRAIVLGEVVQGRPRILSLCAERRAHGADVPGARGERERECDLPVPARGRLERRGIIATFRRRDSEGDRLSLREAEDTKFGRFILII